LEIVEARTFTQANSEKKRVQQIEKIWKNRTYEARQKEAKTYRKMLQKV